MGLAAKLRGLFRGKPRDSDQVAMTRWIYAPMRPGSTAVLKAWREMPWLRTVVDKCADGVAGLNWRIYRGVDPDTGRMMRRRSFQRMPAKDRFEARKALLREGKIVEVDDHPALDVLSNPNDYFSGHSMMKIQQRHMDLAGETFLLLQRRGKQIIGYWVLPTTAILRIPKPGDNPKTYRIAYGTNQFEVPAADILYFRHPDCDDPLARGVGMGYSLGDELDSDEYAARFIKNYFFNNATPAAVISIEGMPEANLPAAKAWKENLIREYGGPENAGKIFVTGGKTSIARLDSSLADMTMVEIRKFVKDFTRQCYGIPPEVLGDVSSSNKATAIAAQAIFAENVVVPRGEFWRTELNHKFMPLFGDDGAFLDYDSPIPKDREHALKVAMAMPAARSMNEWRELQDLEPLEQFEGVFPPLAMPGQSPLNPGNSLQPGAAPDANAPAAPTDADQTQPEEVRQGTPQPELPAPSGKLFANT